MLYQRGKLHASNIYAWIYFNGQSITFRRVMDLVIVLFVQRRKCNLNFTIIDGSFAVKADVYARILDNVSKKPL